MPEAEATRRAVLHPIVDEPDILDDLEPSRAIGAMTEADYVRLVEIFTRATLQKNMDRALSFVADDVEYWNMPDPKPRCSKEAARAFLEPIWMDPRNVYYAYRILRTVASGRTVMHERLDIVQRDGRRLEVPVCGVYVFNDRNEIAIWHDYFDPAAFKDFMDDFKVPVSDGESISQGEKLS